MRAVQYDRQGEPAEVLQLRDIPLPACGPGEARVRMLYSPINPSDLLRIRGIYGAMPGAPQTPGFEGIGIVEDVNHSVASTLLGVKRGRRVVVLNQTGGNWQEHVVVPALRLFPLPPAIADEQAAGFFVNPATALIMVTQVLKVPPGAWLLQSAAGSAVGKMVIQLGKKLGFRTINIVRRSETAQTLRDLGADAVIDTSHTDLVPEVLRLTQQEGVHYALDPVGGPTTTQMIQALGSNGRLLLYGSLDFSAAELYARRIIQHHLTIEGFALQHWTAQRKPIQILFLLKQIAKLMQEGVLVTDIAQVFPLERVNEAIQCAETPGRQGKVLLKIGAAG
jgi:NADPH2:quinone reductase